MENNQCVPDHSVTFKDSLKRFKNVTDIVSEKYPSQSRRSPRIAELKENVYFSTKTPKSLLKTTPSTLKKRVSFGGNLSPEYFDTALPPSSPLTFGAIPKCSRKRREKLSFGEPNKMLSSNLMVPTIQEEHKKSEPEQEICTVDLFDDIPMGILAPPLQADPVLAFDNQMEVASSFPKDNLHSAQQSIADCVILNNKLSTPQANDIMKGRTLIVTVEKLQLPLTEMPPVLNEINSHVQRRYSPSKKDIQSEHQLHMISGRGLNTLLENEIEKGEIFLYLIVNFAIVPEIMIYCINLWGTY